MKDLRTQWRPRLLSILFAVLFCEAGLSATLPAAEFLDLLGSQIDKPAQIPCNAPPLSGVLPVTPNLRFTDFRQSRSFLSALSERTYSIDQKFLTSIGALLEGENADVLSIFVMNAILPFLQNTAEPAVKIQFLEPAIVNLTCLNRAFQIEGLKTFQGIALFQATALKMIRISLDTGLKMMTAAEASEAKNWSSDITKTVDPNFSVERFEKLCTGKDSLSQLIKSLSQRPLLKSRTEMNRKLLDFLVGEKP